MGLLVLDSGQIFKGDFLGGKPRAGEVVFNTSHSGYEEMATDPSYFSQIIVTTATQQGNYGINKNFCESSQMWLSGFICLEIQNSKRDSAWLDRLTGSEVPVLTGVDTRSLVETLRNQGTTWGAILDDEMIARDDYANFEKKVKAKATELILESKNNPKDWTQIVCRKKVEERMGKVANGPTVAVIDFGTKENILRELELRCRKLTIYPSNSKAEDILKGNPDGILLSNGPGNPEDVIAGTETVRQLIGKKFIFGICMGHQVLALALGAKTYKLKFGHRGSNHPIQDRLLNRVYVTSQNHGYNMDQQSLPPGAQVTHINLNDQTAAGFYFPEMKCLSVQFHPESHPGPHDANKLFDFFVEQLK